MSELSELLFLLQIFDGSNPSSTSNVDEGLHCLSLISAIEYGLTETVKEELSKGKVPNSSALFKTCCEMGQFEITKILIQAGVDLNACDHLGKSALFHAVDLSDLHFAEFLLSSGAEVNAENQYGKTPLLYAIELSKEDFAELFLSRGADVNLENQYAITPLYYTVKFSRLNIAELLLIRGAEVNYEDQLGETPLIYAIQFSQIDFANIFLSHGADINAENQLGRNPLYYTMKYSNLEFAKFLLNHGADVKRKNKHGKTPLFFAIDCSELDFVNSLLYRGAKVNVRDKCGKTVLFYALQPHKLELLEILLKNGADVNVKDVYGNTPLHYAINFPDEMFTVADSYLTKPPTWDYFEMLLKRTRNIDVSRDGNTMLHLAVISGMPDNVKRVLKYKPNVDKEEYKGLLLFVIKMNRDIASIKKIVEILLNYGFSVSEEVIQKEKLLQIAVFRGITRLVDHLLELGVDPYTKDREQYLHLEVIKEKLKAFRVACNLKNNEILRVFLKYGLNPIVYEYIFIEAIDKDSLSLFKFLMNSDLPRVDMYLLFFYAARMGRRKILKYLFEFERPSFNANSEVSGVTLAQLIGAQNAFSIVEVLWEYDADLNVVNSIGFTPLIDAFTNRDRVVMRTKKTIEALLHYGADVNYVHEMGFCTLDYMYFQTQAYYKIRKVMGEHMVALNSLGRKVSDKNVPVMLECAEHIRASYRREIQLLKSSVIPDTIITFYELLKCSQNVMASYVKNQEVLEAFESRDYIRKFRNYWKDLQRNVKLGLRRRRLLDEGVEFLTPIFGLPFNIVEYILYFLSNEELGISVGRYRPRETLSFNVIDEDLKPYTLIAALVKSTIAAYPR